MRALGIITMLIGMPILLHAQNEPQIRLRSLDFEEWKKHYTTLDEKGKLLHAVHISELEVDSKWCLDEPVKIAFNSSAGRALKNAGWYEWHPIRKCWVKKAVPKYSAYGNKNDGGEYSTDVNCPGVYGLFYIPGSKGKGIVFKAPAFHKIRQLSIHQDQPGISVVYRPENPSRSLFVPSKELSYSATISAEMEGPSGEVYVISESLLGGICDVDELKTAMNNPTVRLHKDRSDDKSDLTITEQALTQNK